MEAFCSCTTSHMTLTPLLRSKGQRSTCRGRGHIVAASRTACLNGQAFSFAIPVVSLIVTSKHIQFNTRMPVTVAIFSSLSPSLCISSSKSRVKKFFSSQAPSIYTGLPSWTLVFLCIFLVFFCFLLNCLVQYTKAVVTTTIRLRFDAHSTLVRRPFDCLSKIKLCAWRQDMPPLLSSPRGRPSASRAAEQTQRSSTFPR